MLFFIQSGALYSLFLGQLIRKDGEFHSSRLLDEKNMQARQNVQPKKKNRKSGLPTKLREKPQACFQICLQDCPASVPVYHIYTLPLVFVSWLTALSSVCVRWRFLRLMTITHSALKCRRTSYVSTATVLSAVVTISNATFSPIRVRHEPFRSYIILRFI